MLIQLLYLLIFFTLNFEKTSWHRMNNQNIWSFWWSMIKHSLNWFTPTPSSSFCSCGLHEVLPGNSNMADESVEESMKVLKLQWLFKDVCLTFCCQVKDLNTIFSWMCVEKGTALFFAHLLHKHKSLRGKSHWHYMKVWEFYPLPLKRKSKMLTMN